MIVTTFSTIIHTELLTADKETLAEAMKKEWCGNCKTETFYWYGCRNATYCTRCNDRQKHSNDSHQCPVLAADFCYFLLWARK